MKKNKNNKEHKLYYVFDKDTNENLTPQGVGMLSTAVSRLIVLQSKGHNCIIKDSDGKQYNT